MKWIILAVVAAVTAIMFVSDADLGLWLAPNPPDKAFKDQVIWIVGASSGIGAALGLEYCKSHSKVVFSARRVEQLHDLAKQCSALGAEGFVLPLDVTDYSAHQPAVDAVLQKYGQIDTLVLNAGKSQRNLADETPFEVTRDIMELNFFSLVALNKLVLPHMIKRNSGAIMVMSSISGVLGTPVASSYSASKFALHGYFNALRSEVSVHKVGVHIVCPGPVESEISAKSYVNPAYPRQVEGQKMTAERCAELVVRGMYHKLEEMWISEQPVLFITYLTVYLPFLTRQLFVKVLGPARVRALRGGENIYDLKAIFMQAIGRK